jgi:hypothetical protein
LCKHGGVTRPNPEAIFSVAGSTPASIAFFYQRGFVPRRPTSEVMEPSGVGAETRLAGDRDIETLVKFKK